MDIANDDFWDDIDNMFDNNSPFAACAHLPLPIEDIAAPPPPILNKPIDGGVEAESKSKKVQPQQHVSTTLTMERSMSFQVDIVKAAMRAVVEKCGPKITLTRFKKEAVRAWERKFPNSTGRVNKFQAYVKTNMKDIRRLNPTMTHSEHMKLIGRMWKALPTSNPMNPTN